MVADYNNQLLFTVCLLFTDGVTGAAHGAVVASLLAGYAEGIYPAMLTYSAHAQELFVGAHQ